MSIHPSAIVSPKAKLASGVAVGPFSIIGDAVTIGENTKIGASSVVVKSVPPNCTVVGNPGRVVAVHDPDTDTVMRLPDPEGEKIDNLEKKVSELEERLSKIEGKNE